MPQYNDSELAEMDEDELTELADKGHITYSQLAAARAAQSGAFSDAQSIQRRLERGDISSDDSEDAEIDESRTNYSEAELAKMNDEKLQTLADSGKISGTELVGAKLMRAGVFDDEISLLRRHERDLAAVAKMQEEAQAQNNQSRTVQVTQ